MMLFILTLNLNQGIVIPATGIILGFLLSLWIWMSSTSIARRWWVRQHFCFQCEGRVHSYVSWLRVEFGTNSTKETMSKLLCIGFLKTTLSFTVYTTSSLLECVKWHLFSVRGGGYMFGPPPYVPPPSVPLWSLEVSTLIKKKIKFSSYIRKFRVEQLQSHIWGRAS